MTLHTDQIFYHGTNSNFSYFNPNSIGRNTPEMSISGFYFTDCIQTAKLFGERIIKAKLVLSKTIDIRRTSLFNLECQASDIWEICSGEVLTNQEALNEINDKIGLGEIAEFIDILQSEEALSLLIEKGYDSIIKGFLDDKTEYIVLSRDQIKQVNN